MKHIKLYEEFTEESYKTVGSSVKIAGVYQIETDSETQQARVAGFERQDASNDSLYLMDGDPARETIGSFIVKNSDMFKLQKGTRVNATSTKTGKAIKIKRISDL